MRLIDIPVADLRLDGENPRHDPTNGEQKIVAALLADGGGKGGDKIVELGTDIAAHGLSPIDPLMVIKQGATYTVLEGNRRLTAVRLLTNPKLTTDPRFVSAFTTLAKQIAAPVTLATCYVVDTRAQAIHWQELRHNGEAKGRGVADWDPPAKARFFPATRGQVANAVLLADALSTAYPLNTTMLGDMKWVMKNNSSTVGRLLGDVDFRNRLGLALKPKFGAHYSSADLELVFMRIMADLNGSKTVADVYTKTQRADYLLALSSILPDLAKRQAHASPLAPVATPAPSLPILPVPTVPVVAPAGPGAPPTTPITPTPGPPPTTPVTTPSTTKPPSAPSPQPLFVGVKLTKLGARLPLILWELQQLDLNKSPNAAAVLIRAVVELAVSQVFTLNTWPLSTVDKSGHPHDIPLRTLIEKCVNTLDPVTDPKKQDKRYQAVRFGLNNPNSLFSPSSLHAMVHNVNIHPSANDLRSVAASYSDFLAGLDSLVP